MCKNQDTIKAPSKKKIIYVNFNEVPWTGEAPLFTYSQAVCFSFLVGKRNRQVDVLYSDICLLIVFFYVLTVIGIDLELFKMYRFLDVLEQAIHRYMPSVEVVEIQFKDASNSVEEVKQLLPAEPYDYAREILVLKCVVVVTVAVVAISFGIWYI